MRQRRPVYSTAGYTFAVKSWGEPPEGAGGVLILDKRLSPTWVRALSASECRRLQGLASEDETVFKVAPSGGGGAAQYRDKFPKGEPKSVK